MTGTDSDARASFGVTLDYKRFHAEEELVESNGDLWESLRRASTIEGQIVLAGAGGEPLHIVDELAPWIQNLCFRAVPTLGEGDPVTIYYFSRAGTLQLTPAGDEVEIHGDLNPSRSFPITELRAALVGCGSRFLDFARRLKGDDEAYMANLDYVAQFEEPARLSLQEPVW